MLQIKGCKLTINVCDSLIPNNRAMSLLEIKSSEQKVAVVTGSNKGIGFEIVKGLCKQFNGIVYLTSRDASKGQAALLKLKEIGLNPLFHQLDITDTASVNKFHDTIKSKHGGLDLLINNAAISYQRETSGNFWNQAKNTIDINYYGTLRVCEILFPILRQNARVVNISSSAGHLSQIPSAELKTTLGNNNLTLPELNNLVGKFLKDAKENKNEEEGWGKSSYSVSKVFLSALTFIQQRAFDEEIPSRNISVNAVHPGYVQTDLTKNNGPLTPDQGAQAPLYVALKVTYKGEYVWYNGEPYDWKADSTPTNTASFSGGPLATLTQVPMLKETKL